VEVVVMQVATNERPTTRDPAFQGFLILRIRSVVAPILFGLDKLFNFMGDRPTHQPLRRAA
jgi:hypothetical protein